MELPSGELGGRATGRLTISSLTTGNERHLHGHTTAAIIMTVSALRNRLTATVGVLAQFYNFLANYHQDRYLAESAS